MNLSVNALLPGEGATSNRELGPNMNESVYGLVSMPGFFLNFRNGAFANQELKTDRTFDF